MFESARRLARWHYQWIVTHEFLPAIVGQTMSDSVYKEVLDRRPEDHYQVLQADEPSGALLHPGRVRCSRVPLRPQHHPAPLYGPGRLRQRWHSPWLCLGRAAVPGHGHRQQLERAPRVAAPAEDSVEQVLQRGGAEADCPASAPVRRFAGQPAVQDALRRRCPTPTLSVCCRSGISAEAGRWACPRDSRWLG